MMPVIKRHILYEFLKMLLITISSFVLLFLVVDLFENVDDLMEKKVPFAQGAGFFLLKVPFMLSQVSPVAVLLAVLITLGVLSRHNEITAIKAGGMSVLRALSPLFFCGIAISMAVVVINESITPVMMGRAEAMKRAWSQGSEASSFGKEGVWIRTGEGIFNVRNIDFKEMTLHGLTLYSLEKPFAMKERVHSRLVRWEDGKWVAQSAHRWKFFEDGSTEEAEVKNLALPGLWSPEALVTIESGHRNMTFGELYRYIKGLEEDGYDASRYRVDLYGKLTFPLVNFIMVMVGIPFALKTGRHSGIATGVGLSVIIGFSYWIIFAVARSLGQTGILTPLVAAAFPDALFIAIGALMFGYVRQ